MVIGICAECQEEKTVFPNQLTNEPLCQWCQRRARPRQTCGVCGEERPDVYRNKQTGQLTCGRCYKRHGQPRVPCSQCQCQRVVAAHDAAGHPICTQCLRHGRNARKCGICGQKRMVTAHTADGDPICSLCYQMFGRQITCVRCNLVKPMAKKVGPDQYFCRTCAEQDKKGICPVCGHERTLANRLNGQHVCRMCKWASQTGSCRKCGRERPLHVDGYCGGCYGGIRLKRSAARIAALIIGLIVYNQKTLQRGRIRGIRTPIKRRGKPDILRTQLLVDPNSKRTAEDIYWPAIHCRQLKHARRVKAGSDLPVEARQSPS
ncbi:MAG: hypothetical protein AAB402_04520 [Patescibacteria group bacterium]